MMEGQTADEISSLFGGPLFFTYTKRCLMTLLRHVERPLVVSAPRSVFVQHRSINAHGQYGQNPRYVWPGILSARPPAHQGK